MGPSPAHCTGDVRMPYSNPPADDGEDVGKYVRLHSARGTEESQGAAGLLTSALRRDGVSTLETPSVHGGTRNNRATKQK